MIRPVTITYLEMLSPSEFIPAKTAPRPELEIRQAKIPSAELSRFLYTAVGGSWFWIDRLGWTYEQWQSYLERPEVETWIAYASGTPAGYVELEQRYDEGVEIAYFGLLPQFTGRGVGRILLTTAVERAWKLTDKRVSVNTCSLDGPTALQSYISRGFKIHKAVTIDKELPEKPIGPWPGS